MAIPLIPFAGLALGALGSLSLLAIQNLLQDRTFENDPALPDPENQIPPFELPFEGGQCVGIFYNIDFRQTFVDPELTFPENGQNSRMVTRDDIGNAVRGAILGFSTFVDGTNTTRLRVETSLDGFYTLSDGGGSINGVEYTYSEFTLTPFAGSVDNCGNLPNPNAPVPPNVGGGSLAPIVDAPIEVYGGIAIPSFAALLAALKAIADGIAAVGEVLDGVRRIGDAINKIREILDEFLNGEKDKNRKDKDKRKVSVGAWREMLEDGGFGVEKFTAQEIEYSPFQLQIEIEAFPPTVSRRLGIKSPAYAHLEPIGWVFLRSSNGGYSEPVPLRYLRNSISLNEDTNGVSYSFRENPLTKAKCRVWWSSDPDVTGNI